MLADEGMSTREIAPVIGKAKQTVHDDLRLARGEVTGNRSPAKEVSVIIAEANFPTSSTIRGRDGKDYTRPTPTPVDDAEVIEEAPAPRRRPVVAELSAAGMSTRQIAPIVGVSNKTVHQDIAGVTSGNTSSDVDYTPHGLPTSEKIVGSDGNP